MREKQHSFRWRLSRKGLGVGVALGIMVTLVAPAPAALADSRSLECNENNAVMGENRGWNLNSECAYLYAYYESHGCSIYAGDSDYPYGTLPPYGNFPTGDRDSFTVYCDPLPPPPPPFGSTTPPPPPPPQRRDYVNLGDSYGAGTGASSPGQYLAGTCYRSPNNYAHLAHGTVPRFAGLDLIDNSCSGALAANLFAAQGNELSVNTELVTITAGGNDVGFGGLIKQCRINFVMSSCIEANTSSRQLIEEQLPGLVLGLIRDVTARAPHAQIMFTGYPVPYALTSDCGPAGLDVTRRVLINDTVSWLNQGIDQAIYSYTRSADRETNTNVSFASVTQNFEGHRLCDSGEQYINNLIAYPFPGGVYHANALGHRFGYLPAIQFGG